MMGQPDMSKAEQVDYEQDRPMRCRLKLKDGTVIDAECVLKDVFRVGNDPNTGIPAYTIQSNLNLRTVGYDKSLRTRTMQGLGKTSEAADGMVR